MKKVHCAFFFWRTWLFRSAVCCRCKTSTRQPRWMYFSALTYWSAREMRPRGRQLKQIIADIAATHKLMVLTSNPRHFTPLAQPF